MKWVFCLLLVAVVSSGYTDDDKSSTPQQVVAIWPLKIGNQWTYEDQLLDTEVTVPAGTFICVNYLWGGQGESDKICQYHYLSPGAGWVKGEEYYRTDGGLEYPRSRNLLISRTLRL